MAEIGNDMVSLSGLTADPEEWIDCFIDAIECRDMAWPKALDLLRSLFEGNEKVWFNSLHENELHDPFQFKEAFLVKFGIAINPEVTPPTQGLHESVAEYYDRQLTFSRRESIGEWEMVDDLVNGLKVPLRIETRRENPGTLKEARKIAMTWETFYIGDKQKGEAEIESSKQKSRVTNEDLSASIQKLSEKLELLVAKQKHENELQYICHYCDRPRHKQSHCRLKQKNMQKLDFVRKMLVGLRSISGDGYYQPKCAYCLKPNHNDMAELACPLLKRDLQSQGLLPLA